MDFLYISFELGLLYSIVVFGIFLTFRILKFPDLTVDGSFVTGAIIGALALKMGMPAAAALFLSFAAGFSAGALTAFIHIKFGIGKILSSIISLSMLYSINLRLMNGPNLSLLNQPNILSWFKYPADHIQVIFFLFILIILIKISLDWFLNTEIGFFIRATGDNESTVQSFGVNPNFTKFLGISLGNAFVGLGGGFISQNQGFVDINMGLGIITLGVASYMLGEIVIPGNRLKQLTMAVIIGSIIYQLIINISLRFGLAGSDIKFFTSLILLILLILRLKQKKKFYGTTIPNL